MGVSSECFSFASLSFSVFVCLFLRFVFGVWFWFMILLAIRPPVLSSNTPPLSFIPPMTMIDREALQAHAFATKPAKPQGGGS